MRPILRRIEQIQELKRGIYRRVRAPGRGLGVAAQVTVKSRDGPHAGGFAGLDIAQVIADIDAPPSGQGQSPGGLQQRRGMWFGMWRRITTDHRPRG